jgi:hypothetical protein
MRAAARGSAGLAASWAGVLLTVAFLAAPAAFATLAPADAGRFAGRLFAREAYVSLGFALVLLFVERRRARLAAAEHAGSIFSVELMLVLGTIFCTVAGYFAVEPMMAAARLEGSTSAPGAPGLGVLHAVSVGFFGLKGLLVLALAWRFSRL